MVRSLRLALGQLGLAAVAFVGTELVLIVTGPPDLHSLKILYLAVGSTYIATGLFAWDRRPSNRIGALLCLAGFGLLAGVATNTGVSWLVGVGTMLETVPIATLIQLLLSFPSGRLPDRRSRIVVSAAYVVSLVLQAPFWLLSPDPQIPSALKVASRPDLLPTFFDVQRGVGYTVILATALILVSRLRRTRRPQLHVLAPLYLYGVLSVLLLITPDVLHYLFGLGPLVRFKVQMGVFAGLPVVFATVLLRGGFARMSEVEELGARLAGSEQARVELRAALGQTLGDPSLRLLFARHDQSGYVDASGRPAALPAEGSGRAWVGIELAGEQVAAVDYNAALIADPDLVRAGGRVIGLALERERLTAELLAHTEALRESRARIVEAADTERRRIARDLHDGLQARLVVLALQAGQLDAAQATQLSDSLEDAITELRRLVHGFMPELLVERGLAAACEELADRMPIPTSLQLAGVNGRLPAATESTGYFVVAEALANAVKHAQASALSVRLARCNGHLEIEVTDDGVGGTTVGAGAGLRGIADRVDVLGGQLTVHSPAGAGTRLRAEIPCVS